MTFKFGLILSVAVIVLSSGVKAELNATNVIVAFNNAAQDDVRTLGIPNQLSAKVYALTHLAQYLAITGAPLDANTTVKSAYAAYAGHAILNLIAPWRYAKHDAALAPFTANLTADIKAAANNSGTEVAVSVFNARSTDGFTNPGSFTPAPFGNGTAGAYQYVANQTGALYPQLAKTKTFVVGNISQFDQGPPNNVTSAAYGKDLAEVFVIGVKNSTERTPYQTETAYFWADGNTTSAIGGHFNQIAAKVIPANTSLTDVAKIFAQANAAAFDANVAGWAVKYKYLFWRPVTAIQQGDGTNTNLTNPTWAPELATPPHPEYASGHQYTASAIATVLSNFLNTTNVTFSIGTEYPGLPPRNYTSLQQAVDDVGVSRVYGGIHFRKSIAAGNALGAAVAESVIDNWGTANFTGTSTSIKTTTTAPAPAPKSSGVKSAGVGLSAAVGGAVIALLI